MIIDTQDRPAGDSPAVVMIRHRHRELGPRRRRGAEAPAPREGLITRLRAEIAAGTYLTDRRLALALERLVRDIGRDDRRPRPGSEGDGRVPPGPADRPRRLKRRVDPAGRDRRPVPQTV